MAIETHKIKRQNGQIEFYRKINNPHEIAYFFISVGKILAFSTLLFLAGMFCYMESFTSIVHFIMVMIFVALCILGLYSEIPQVITTLKRNLRPILTINELQFITLDRNGNYVKAEIQKIRSVDGMMYSETKRTEAPVRIYFTEILIGMSNGDYLSFDVINSSKLYRPIPDEVTKELKDKTKKIGTLIAKELNTQFFLKRGYSKIE